MRLTAIKYGESTIAESIVFAGGDSRKTRPISFLVYLVETEGRKILVDAGCTTMADCWEMKHFCGVLPILHTMGISPQEITDVIVTHAHHDHIETVGAFPRARVYIQENELPEGRAYIPSDTPITTFATACTVCEGVRAVTVGGHSIGSCVVEVAGTDTTYVIAGDECYSMDCVRHHIPTGASCNPANSQRFLDTYATDDYTVLLCHDPAILPDRNGFQVMTERSDSMYPLLLQPPVKDYLWGGNRLVTEFGLKADTDIAAEGWMLSCHKDGANTVLNGEHAGKSLPEVLEAWGDAALGKRAAAFPYFPILIKLIDAKQKLSVQVHPNDEYALEHEGEFGKTEMWYVVDCKEGAQLLYGFSRNISKGEFQQRMQDNTLTEVCNAVSVHRGDVFFIDAGTLHAIGEGILIAEVQQNSNTTYRISDYGRLGADGKPRQLHMEKALDVTKTEVPSLPYGSIGTVTTVGENTVRELASCRFFKAKAVELRGTYPIAEADSFVSLVILDGTATLTDGKSPLSLSKGESVFIPAGLAVTLEGTASLLMSSL